MLIPSQQQEDIIFVLISSRQRWSGGIIGRAPDLRFCHGFESCLGTIT